MTAGDSNVANFVANLPLDSETEVLGYYQKVSDILKAKGILAHRDYDILPKIQQKDDHYLIGRAKIPGLWDHHPLTRGRGKYDREEVELTTTGGNSQGLVDQTMLKKRLNILSDSTLRLGGTKSINRIAQHLEATNNQCRAYSKIEIVAICGGSKLTTSPSSGPTSKNTRGATLGISIKILSCSTVTTASSASPMS